MQAQKVALVTGSSSGMGFETALLLARSSVGNDASTLLQARRNMSDAEFGNFIKQQFLSRSL
jgi:NAD(P)-dependent dehydrogenase (short-subunit alcohol dehydrogenase family)